MYKQQSEKPRQLKREQKLTSQTTITNQSISTTYTLTPPTRPKKLSSFFSKNATNLPNQTSTTSSVVNDLKEDTKSPPCGLGMEFLLTSKSLLDNKLITPPPTPITPSQLARSMRPKSTSSHLSKNSNVSKISHLSKEELVSYFMSRAEKEKNGATESFKQIIEMLYEESHTESNAESHVQSDSKLHAQSIVQLEKYTVNEFMKLDLSDINSDKQLIYIFLIY